MNKKTKIVLLEFGIMLIICSFNDKTLLIAFLWIILHELTHIIVAKHYGASLSSLEINLSGAKIKLNNIEELDNRKKLTICSSFVNICNTLFAPGPRCCTDQSPPW